MFFRIAPLLITIFLLLAGSNAEAQKRFRRFKSQYQNRMYHHGEFSYIAGAGISSYFGDLKDNSLNLWAKPSIQLGAQYRVNNHLYIRSEIMWYRLSGADSLNNPKNTIPEIINRNLSFRSDNFELNTVGLWHLFNKYSRYNRPILNPYGFAGIAVTTYNPKALLEGVWYDLRPLQTEGVAYGKFTMAIPLGLGLTYHIDNSWDVSFEYGYRITFNDRLDDVSGAYLGVENIKDEIRRKLSDRRPELALEPMPAGFPARGNSKVNDWYLINALKITYTPDASMRKLYKRPKQRGGFFRR